MSGVAIIILACCSAVIILVTLSTPGPKDRVIKWLAATGLLLALAAIIIGNIVLMLERLPK